MSRDYKSNPDHPKKASKDSPFFTGLLVGFLLGVAASLAMVMFIKGGESPFANLAGPNGKSVSDKIQENEKKSDADAQAATSTQSPDDTNNQASDNKDDKTRFDFYNILPGNESKVSTEEINIKEGPPQSAAQNTYFLQVGAFQTATEADNMKATLALQGFEALVQTESIPDKGVWHRVRVGPLKNLDQINKTKIDLANNGFKTDLIKMNNENQ